MQKLQIKSSTKIYDVLIDNNLVKLLNKNLSFDSKYFFIIDKALFNTVYSKIKSVYSSSFFILLKGGETIKSARVVERIYKKLVSLGYSKSDTIVGIGGGTICDLSGYIAATYKRGINLILVPTTTLSMIDAAIGGKNAINISKIKNAVGTIYAPSKVLIGLDVLNTLSSKSFNEGLVEALKIGMLFNEELYSIFKTENLTENIEKIIYLSILEKAKLVELDEFDCNERKLLNFGHTIGHSLETISNLKLSHGQAVANGIYIMAKNCEYRDDLIQIFSKLGISLLNPFPNNILNIIVNDKKVKNNTIDIVKLDKLYEPKIVNINIDEIKELL